MPRPADSDSADVQPSGEPGLARSRPIARLASFGGLLALAVVTFAYPSATRMHSWPIAVQVAALGFFPVAVVLAGLIRDPAWNLPPRLTLIGISVLALGAVVSAATSPFAAASLARLGPTLGGCALYLWLHHTWTAEAARSGATLPRAARFLAGAALAFAIVSVGLWSRGAWPLPWGDRNSIPFGHSVYTAGAAILCLPWIAAQAWDTRGPRRALWIAGVVATLVVLVSTSSRGAVLALAFTAALGTAVALALGPWSRGRKLFLAAAALAIAGLTVLTNPRLRDLVVRGQWSDAARESNDQRTAMLAAGFELGRIRPLLGWGPGTVPLAYPQVRASLDGGTENILQLHNTPAQLWATTGTAGLVALALLAAGALGALARARRTPATLAAAASLIGYGVMTLTDHQLDLPFFAAMLAAGLAVLTAAAPRATPPYRPTGFTRGLATTAIAGAAVLAGGATIRDLAARRHYDQALTALGANQGEAYLAALDRATAAAPHDPYFQHSAAAWLLEQRATTPDPALQATHARNAAARLERSLATGAHTEFAHFNLGWLQLDLGQPAAAIRHFTSAARLVPDKGGVYFGLGLAYEAIGQRPAAIRAFALEWVNDPRSLTSPAWEIPMLAALLPVVHTETQTLLARLATDRPTAAGVAAWLRWWSGDTAPNPALPLAQAGWNTETTQLLAALPVLESGSPPPDSSGSAAWMLAGRAWQTVRQSAGPASAADATAFLTVAGSDPAFAAALARRAIRHRASFRAFLSASTDDDPALIHTYRRHRPGYGVLALHPEGPPLADLYIVQDNRVATVVAAGLFPPKGWLPGRFLLALLPESSR